MKLPALRLVSPRLALLGLAALTLLGACYNARRISEEELGPVRRQMRLPTGVSCELLGHVTVRDGTGCGYMGGSRPGQSQTLDYNLTKEAERHQANLIIPDGPAYHDSWEGCPSNGLIQEAKLYRCAFPVNTPLRPTPSPSPAADEPID